MKKTKKILLGLAIIASVFIFSGCGSEDNAQVAGTQTQSADATEVNQKLAELAITTGPTDAKVTIIEASDFECPACRHWAPEFDKTVQKYVDKVKFGYIPFPLSYHESAMPAALAVEAAAKQGKGWEMFTKLFEGEALDLGKIDTTAKDLGLDMDKFNADKDSQEVKDKIEKAKTLLTDLNLQGTPTYYINGQEYSGTPTLDALSIEIDKLLK